LFLFYAKYYVNPYQSNFIPNQENDEELNKALAESEKYFQKEQTLKKAKEKIEKNNSNNENSFCIPILKSPEKQNEESNANFDYLNGREVQVKEFFNVQQEKYKRYKQDNAKTTQSETNGSDKNERYEY
jgi:hypothetical protein